jgi:CheY-like chemotaxis protein
MAAGTILVVEDDADIRGALCAILQEEGYAVVGARDGSEALMRLRSGEPPSLILLDLMMPVMNGSEFRSAQLRDPRLAAIPVVLLTADSRFDEVGRALGTEAALSKPFELDALLLAVERASAGPDPTALAKAS